MHHRLEVVRQVVGGRAGRGQPRPLVELFIGAVFGSHLPDLDLAQREHLVVAGHRDPQLVVVTVLHLDGPAALDILGLPRANLDPGGARPATDRDGGAVQPAGDHIAVVDGDREDHLLSRERDLTPRAALELCVCARARAVGRVLAAVHRGRRCAA